MASSNSSGDDTVVITGAVELFIHPVNNRTICIISIDELLDSFPYLEREDILQALRFNIAP
ncbi:MAG: DUF433 domain-containing protein [Spirochaetaceae bacterium]|nr:DUF433 domain-containing protein [Spirochaetaceae bacterium]